jgi:phage terminase large subunit GpA-like protein
MKPLKNSPTSEPSSSDSPARQLWCEAAANSLKPPEKLTVSQWADKHRRLSPESSAEPGRWKTSKAEYQRGIMDSISDRRIHTVVVKSSAQIGKTEILLNIAGYYIDQDPAPMLFLQPTQSMALAFSKDRLTPACRDSPRLAGKLADVREETGASKATKKGSTLLQKVYPGGHISLAGMNSASELASRPVRVVLIDEVDRAPANVGGQEAGEGDPVSLARKRSQTFWNRKTILVSTPTIEGMSRIDDEWQESDQRKFYVPCPHCGEPQVLEWKHVKWPPDEPQKAQYCCQTCGALWSDTQRWKAVGQGEWRITRPEVLSIAGFHINELYSPWSKLGDMATAFVIAKRGGPEQLKTWVNTSLGECWIDEEGETVSWEMLHARREDYPHRDKAPDGVTVLVAGADVQDNRIEYEIVGYGAGETSWGIKYGVLVGDPGQPQFWGAFKAAMTEEFTHPSGQELKISMVCIDSGHFTDQVYAFCRDAGIHWAIPVKGSSEYARPIAKFPRKQGKDTRVYLTIVGTDTAKELIYSRYKIRDPDVEGYCHYPISEDYNETYFQQATAERRIRKYRKGTAFFEWDAGYRRNEALDCRVYALAALKILRQNFGLKVGKLKPRKDRIEDRDVINDADPKRSYRNRPIEQPRSQKARRKPSGWSGVRGKW